MAKRAEHRLGWRGYIAPPRSQLTLWVYIVIVGVLVVLLINAMQREAVKYEALAVETTLKQMRLHLTVLQTRARIGQKPVSLPLNPVSLFEEEFPMDYRGEFDRASELEGEGYWYYLRKEGVLVYRPQWIEQLNGYGSATGGEFRFRVNPHLIVEVVASGG